MEPNEDTGPYRRFGLADGMIIMVALALALVVLRGQAWFIRFPLRVAYWWRTSLALMGARPWDLPALPRGQAASLLVVQILDEIVIQLLSSVLFGLTLTQPLLRLRHPRPPLRDLVRQSGLAVCLGVILGAIIMVDLSWMAGTDVLFFALYRYPVLPLLLLWPLLGIFPWRTEESW